MNDRELLELAAKAAGIAIQRSRLEDPIFRDMLLVERSPRDPGQGQGWNPLTNDGDLLRLAAVLCIDFRWDFADRELRASCIEQGRLGHVLGGHETEIFYRYSVEDVHSAAAYRRAGVMLAAVIGKAMP
jgi:GAF domain-containing protein